jgi:ring-1,2-phenylacetyl-CoA epoxidase subunit PaaB
MTTAQRWEVLGRRTHEDPWTAVGSVHAPDVEMALLLAKESFFRHGEGVDFAVVRETDIHRFPTPDMLAFVTDKSYKLQSGYTGMGQKRRRAMARAEAAGAVVNRPRPQDRRVFRERGSAGSEGLHE